jgi:hypothetical protein
MYHIPIEDPTDSPITIRAARPQDVEAMRRLAQRDSRAVPDGELLIALVDGEARAAISLANGETIADPFHRTQELVGMLTLRGSRLRGETRQRQRTSSSLLVRRAASFGSGTGFGGRPSAAPREQ